MTKKDIARFWAKVNVLGPDDCWEWLAGTNDKGYGNFWVEGKTLRPHRISWELTHGPIPEGLHCLHHCDNRVCVNPSHLFLGTNKVNVDDRVLKGRTFHPIGESHSLTKLSNEQVLEIRRLYTLENHVSQAKLGILFGVKRSVITKIISRKTWSHI